MAATRLAIALAACGLLAASCSSGVVHKSAAPTTTSPPVQTQPPATTPPPPTTTTTEDPGQVATAWVTANAGALQNIVTDVNDITNFGNSGDAAGIVSACQQLATDTATVQALGPFPVASLQPAWTQALANYALAAQTGIIAIQTADPSQVAAYKADINNANAEVQTVTNAVQGMG